MKPPPWVSFHRQVKSFIGNWLPATPFAKAAAVLAGGAVMAQGITTLFTPVLTRFYSPFEFGEFAVYSSVLSILLVVASLRYEMAITLPDEDETAVDVASLSLVLTAILGLVLFVVLAFGHEVIFRTLGIPQLARLWWILPLSVVSIGSYQVSSYWATRARAFRTVSRTKGVQALAQGGGQLLGGIAQIGSIGLIGGYIVGHSIGIRSLLRGSGWRWKWPCMTKLWAVAKRYRSFPKYTLGAGVLNIAGSQLPILLFAQYFTLVQTGNLSLTLRVLAVPAIFVGQAIGQAFYPTIARLHGNRVESRRLIANLTGSLLMISTAGYGIIAILGKPLFAIVFGSEWGEAGLFARFLVPWFIFSFVSSPLSTFVIVVGRQRAAFFMAIYESILRVGAMVLGIYLQSATMAIAMYGLAGGMICLTYIGWIHHLSGGHPLGWLVREAVWIGGAMLLAISVVLLFVAGLSWLAVGLTLIGFGSLAGVGVRRLARGDLDG